MRETFKYSPSYYYIEGENMKHDVETLGKIEINEREIHMTRIDNKYIFAYPMEDEEKTKTIEADDLDEAKEKFFDYARRMAQKIDVKEYRRH